MLCSAFVQHDMLSGKTLSILVRSSILPSLNWLTFATNAYCVTHIPAWCGLLWRLSRLGKLRQQHQAERPSAAAPLYTRTGHRVIIGWCYADCGRSARSLALKPGGAGAGPPGGATAAGGHQAPGALAHRLARALPKRLAAQPAAGGASPGPTLLFWAPPAPAGGALRPSPDLNPFSSCRCCSCVHRAPRPQPQPADSACR